MPSTTLYVAAFKSELFRLSCNYFVIIVVADAVTCHHKFNTIYVQALEHSKRAVELSDSNEAKSDAYHLQGGILKDLGRMEEAEGVSP